MDTDRTLLTLKVEGRAGLDLDRPSDEPERRLREDDLARLGCLLQTCRGIRRVPSYEVAIGNDAFTETVPVSIPVRVARTTPYRRWKSSFSEH